MSKKNILIVDDEPDVALTAKYNINEDDEYNIEVVNSGEECLEFLEKNGKPDLIVLDIMMPGMSGWEVHKKLKENSEWMNIPIIFLTARVDDTAEHAGKFLAEDYIEKPYQPEDLKNRVKRILQD
ncbi:MAG: response regulator [Candidatus Thermoplasmatota archaeon]